MINESEAGARCDSCQDRLHDLFGGFERERNWSDHDCRAGASGREIPSRITTRRCIRDL